MFPTASLFHFLFGCHIAWHQGAATEIKQKPKEYVKFKTWKTIKLGTGLKTADDFRRALKAAGCGIGAFGTNEILESPGFKVASKETEVELVNVTLRMLGFNDDATFGQIYPRAIEFGLELGPAEVGPQLRLQYLDQPKEDIWLNIGMNSIITKQSQHIRERENCIFTLNNADNGLWLATIDVSDPNAGCLDSRRFIFLKRTYAL